MLTALESSQTSAVHIPVHQTNQTSSIIRSRSSSSSSFAEAAAACVVPVPAAVVDCAVAVDSVLKGRSAALLACNTLHCNKHIPVQLQVRFTLHGGADCSGEVLLLIYTLLTAAALRTLQRLISPSVYIRQVGYQIVKMRAHKLLQTDCAHVAYMLT